MDLFMANICGAILSKKKNQKNGKNGKLLFWHLMFGGKCNDSMSNDDKSNQDSTWNDLDPVFLPSFQFQWQIS